MKAPLGINLKKGFGAMLKILPPLSRSLSEVVEIRLEFSGEEDKGEKRLRTLGTFGGVFTHSFLTIISVIMYLRFSWIVGNAGLFHTIIIGCLVNTITFISLPLVLEGEPPVWASSVKGGLLREG